MGSFERFKTKTHFNSLKRLVGVTALAALAVKLLTIALATAAGDGTPVDLLARVPASVADLGAALLVFEVLRPRRPLQLAARSAILVAVSPVLFVASGIHGDRVGVAVALLLLARSLDQGLAGWLLGPGRPLVLAAAVVPAVVWVRRRPRRVYAAVGLVLLTPLALGPAWSPRDLVWPAVFGYLGDARWASIYAVAAGATLLWTSTWWGSGVPWHGGVDPATVPAGAVAALGLVIWVVLGSWAFLGWRTVTVESGPGSGIRAVDNGARPASWAATLPPGADVGGAGSGVPANYHDHNHNPAHVPANDRDRAPANDPALANDADPGPVPANDPGSVPANGSAPEPVGRGTSSSRGSVSLPKYYLGPRGMGPEPCSPVSSEGRS